MATKTKTKAKKRRAAKKSRRKGYNEYGLSRYVEQPIQLAIRRRSRFGCVICGHIICEYAHIDPPFEEARPPHDPGRMALLCDTHHRLFDQKPKRQISLDRMKEAMLHPYNEEHDPWWNTELGPGQPNLHLGMQLLTGHEIRIECNGHVVLGVRSPSVKRAPWEFTGRIYGSKGERLVHFESNNLLANADATDIKYGSSELTVGPEREPLLRLMFDADHRTITLDRLQMRLGGGHFLLVDSLRAEVLGPVVRVVLGTPHPDRVRAVLPPPNIVAGNSYFEGAQFNACTLNQFGYANCSFKAVTAGRPTVLKFDHPALGQPSQWAESPALDPSQLPEWREHVTSPGHWMVALLIPS